MVSLHSATIALWVVPIVLQVAIAAAMVYRGLVKIFPVFFSYTVLVPSRDIVLFFLPYPGNLYSLFYLCGEAISVLLSLAVIFEIMRHLFPPHPFLAILRKVIWILGGAASTAALLLFCFTDRGTATDLAFESVTLLERSARFLQVCLLIAVISLVSRLGLTWHHYSVGILAGFGVYSALDLALLEFRGHWHVVTDAAFVLFRPAAYNLAALIWAGYFLTGGRRGPVKELPENDLAEWTETVTAYIERCYRRY